MKVLVLGTGTNNIHDSHCHACMTIDEYKFCINDAKTNGILVTLDSNASEDPDIVATVGKDSWGQMVKAVYSDEFDIIIDAIGSSNHRDNYLNEAEILLKSDGLFYGYLENTKTIWFKGNGKLHLSEKSKRCSFCRLDTNNPESWTNKRGNTYVRCDACKKVSKQCKKHTGQYYSVNNNQYVTGAELHKLLYGKSSLLVLDLHGVADILPVTETCELIRRHGVDEIWILSYVGSTTQQRIDAHTYILDLIHMSSVPVHGWLCFYKSAKCEVGNKGGFLKCFPDVSRCILLDDSNDNVAAAKDAGAQGVLVTNETSLRTVLYCPM